MLLSKINKLTEMYLTIFHLYVIEYFLLIFAIAWAINSNKFYNVIVLVRFSGYCIEIFSERWLKPAIRINLIIRSFTGHKSFDHYEIRLIYSFDDPIISAQRQSNGCCIVQAGCPRPDIVFPTPILQLFRSFCLM